MITPVRMLGSLSKVSQTRRNVKNYSILPESCTVTCLLRNLFDISCMDVASMCISNSKKVNGRMHISCSIFFYVLFAGFISTESSSHIPPIWQLQIDFWLCAFVVAQRALFHESNAKACYKYISIYLRRNLKCNTCYKYISIYLRWNLCTIMFP